MASSSLREAERRISEPCKRELAVITPVAGQIYLTGGRPDDTPLAFVLPRRWSPAPGCEPATLVYEPFPPVVPGSTSVALDFSQPTG